MWEQVLSLLGILAYLERDGQISAISLKREPRVLNVSVENGVETVRLELG